jgi:hypothetical protein
VNRSVDERVLAFLEGELSAVERERLLDEVERSGELAQQLRSAAVGMASLEGIAEAATSPRAESPPREPSPREGRRVPSWWVAAAAAASAAVVAPLVFSVASRGVTAPTEAITPDVAAAIAAGRPTAPDPSFVLVLQGWWPDSGSIDAEEVQRRSREYWGWTSRLAQEGRLVAAGDLRIEPGARLGPGGVASPATASPAASPDFVIGMFALRASTYEEAVALARECPHLRYGGSVAVRRVGGGFVTVPGMGDWTD